MPKSRRWPAPWTAGKAASAATGRMKLSGPFERDPDHEPASREPLRRCLADFAARVAFLARLHRKASAEEWLRHIIRERVEIEEAAFVGAKQDLAARTR